MEKITYNPLKFATRAEIFTLTVIGSFVTIKLINSMYENIYEPAIAMCMPTKDQQYFIKIGRTYLQINLIIEEFAKWIILIVILMLVFNFITHRAHHKSC